MQDAIIYGAAAGGGVAVLILAIVGVVCCVVRSRREKSNSSKYSEKLFFFICFVMIAMNLAPMKSIATTSEETPTGKIDCLYFFENRKNSFIDCKFLFALAPSQSTTSTRRENKHASEMILLFTYSQTHLLSVYRSLSLARSSHYRN